MNKKITALAFAGFAALALSACSGNKAPTEERTGAAGSADGKKVFEGLCMACHSADSAIPFSPSRLSAVVCLGIALYFIYSSSKTGSVRD